MSVIWALPGYPDAGERRGVTVALEADNVGPANVSIHLCHECRGELDVGRDPRCDAAWKMEVGPPESPCGGRFQTAYMLR